MGNNCCIQRNHWVAKEAYHPSTDADVMLKINPMDNLKMLDESVKLNSMQYFKMKNLSTKSVGLVLPANVAKKGSDEFHTWYFGELGRAQAMEYLQAPQNNEGSFLIRKSERNKGEYTLMLKVWNATDNCFVVKNHRIKYDGSFYISEKRKFCSLLELVSAYQNCHLNHLACKLTHACIKTNDVQQQLIDKGQLRWNIPRSELEILDHTLGHGNFGSVTLAKYKGVHTVAVKQIINCSDEKMFMDETRIMKSINHPNLVQVLGVVHDKKPFYLVMEYLENKDLRNFLKTQARENTNFSKLLKFCENISAGMSELARCRIIHRDLAARNVLLDKWFTAKVSDFGLAKEGGEYSACNSKFPIRWTAPESLKNSQFSLKSDVWSFGVVMWEIFSYGETPYSGLEIKNIHQMLMWINDKRYRLSKPNYQKTSLENMTYIYKMMMTCWAHNPEDRPTMEELHGDILNFGKEEFSSKYSYDVIEYQKNKVGKSNSTGGSKISRRYVKTLRKLSNDKGDENKPVEVLASTKPSIRFSSRVKT